MKEETKKVVTTSAKKDLTSYFTTKTTTKTTTSSVDSNQDETPKSLSKGKKCPSCQTLFKNRNFGKIICKQIRK